MSEHKGSPTPLTDQIAETVGGHPRIASLTHAEVLENAERIRRAAAPHAPCPPPVVPKRYERVRFSSTEPRPDVEGWDAALDAVGRWMNAVRNGEPALLALLGPKGTGKSHLAGCAVWGLWESDRIRVPWYPWWRLVDDLRYGRASGQGEPVPGHAIRGRWHATQVCVVDECRPTSGTDFDAIELAKFSMERYDEQKAALLTCNWSSLEELMGEPAADRWTVVGLHGPSFRS